MQLDPSSAPLRLAVIAPGEIFGGAERQILTLLQGIQSNPNWSLVLVVFHDRELSSRARDIGIRVEVLDAGGKIDWRSIRFLRRLLHTERIDVVSLHGYRASIYLAIALASRRIGAVKTQHGLPEASGTGLTQRIRPYLYRRLELAADRTIGARIVYVTDDLRRLCRMEHSGLHASVIYNGIEPIDRSAIRRPPEIVSGHINLLVLGRLEPVKGVDVAIRALALPTMPIAARLVVVGAGPEFDRLQALAIEFGVAARVDFLGFRANAHDYIAHADALLMPSHHEGLPYSMLEAMSLRTPLIVSNVGGMMEVHRYGNTALLIEPANPAAVADAVKELVETPGLRAVLTENSVKLLRTHFSADQMVRQYSDIFRLAHDTAKRSG